MNIDEKEKLLSDFERELPPVRGSVDSEEGKPLGHIVTELPGATSPNYLSASQLYKACKMKPRLNRYWCTNITGI